MELKEFSSRKDFLDNYNFPKGKVDEIGCFWFMSPIEYQLSCFNKGLGKITYFETVKRDLEANPYAEDLEKLENRTPFMYKMIVDYVLIGEYVHDDGCKCGCNENNQAKLLKLDGFDNCYLGIGESYGEHPALIYDYLEILEQLQKDGMAQEEAEEYFEFNILGSYLGEKMPIFLNRIPLEDLDAT